MNRLIVTADDFGLCPEADEAICLLSDRGIVRRTTLIVNMPHFEASVDALRQRPGLEVGIHLNLTDGRPVLPPADVPTLTNRHGEFLGGRHYSVLTRIAGGRMSLREIHAEWRGQIRKARASGIEIQHLSSHGHLHLVPRLQAIAADLVAEFEIPDVRLVLHGSSARGIVFRHWSRQLLRTLRERGLRVTFPDRILGLAHQGSLTGRRLTRAIAAAGDGVAELIVHPAIRSNEFHRRWRYDGRGETEALLSREVVPLLRGTC